MTINKHEPGIDLTRAKAEYERITPSTEWRNQILAQVQTTAKEQAKKKKKRTWVKYWISSAAAIFFSLVVLVNASPVFADTVAGIPGLAGVVKIMTLGHYEYDKDGMEANVDTPKIEGLENKELEKQLNQEFEGYAAAIIAGFQSDVDELQKEFPGETVHYGLDSGYQVLTNTDDYLAIDIYLVNTVGSSSTVHKFYTIDKHTQKRLTLEDLFVENANYQEVLGDYIMEQMITQNDSGKHTYWIDEPDFLPDPLVTPDSLFYINPKGQLVICFEKYSVAPGSEGTPEFVIPNQIISTILK